jgi:2',3'-cyclic-nucleotide 2'-phosphodiesterase
MDRAVTIAFLGDIYGSPGRMVVEQQLPALRSEHRPELIIANGENARSGSGLSPKLYRRLRELGIDAITLGDHIFRDQRIAEVLQQPDEPILRPANVSAKAIGRPYVRLPIPHGGGSEPRSVFVITVLGRIFFSMPADDPFAAVNHLLASFPEPNPLVIVEAHMEATSEKAALAHYLDGRVAAVIGSHTHVPTADARILPGGTGFITDVGMCGPYAGVIGATAEPVIHHMTTGMHAPFTVASGQEAMCGVVVRIDLGSRRTISINRVRYEADHAKPPFV